MKEYAVSVTVMTTEDYIITAETRKEAIEIAEKKFLDNVNTDCFRYEVEEL